MRLYILIVGSVVSVLRAFHLVRLERDTARRGPVGDKHREHLRRSLSSLRVNIARNDPCRYESGEGTTRRDAFRVHYSELVQALDHWDAVVIKYQAAHAAWVERLVQESSERGVVQPTFDQGRIIEALIATTDCPWPDFSPRFWPREVPTPRSGCSVLGQRRSTSVLTRFLHPE